MQESPFYEALRQCYLQEGIERGARAHALADAQALSLGRGLPPILRG